MERYIKEMALVSRLEWDNDIKKWTLKDNDLEQLPTAEVEEVRHGKWVPYEQPLGTGYSIPNYKPAHYCSNCEGLGWEFFKRCPHCGAYMDGTHDNTRERTITHGR